MAVTLLQPVPQFAAPMTSGSDFSLSDYRGKTLVLFFYPRDNTPGCTVENQEFSALYDQFMALNTLVFGISRDSLKAHHKFQISCALNIPLISDENETICMLFDVIKDKTMYGKPVRGIERSTFILDEEGRLIHIWRKVKAEGHAEEVLGWIKDNKRIS